MLKIENSSLYKNIETNITVDAKKEYKKINNQLNKSTLNTKKYETDERGLANSVSHKGRKLPELTIDDYTHNLPRGKMLQNSVPYGIESRRNYEEYLRKKEKWLIKKGFENNFGRADAEKRSIIPNYVFITPSRVSLHKYNFRDVHKDKWLNKNSFEYKNSGDLIL